MLISYYRIRDNKEVSCSVYLTSAGICGQFLYFLWVLEHSLISGLNFHMVT